MSIARALVSVLLVVILGSCASAPEQGVAEDKPDAAPTFFDMTNVENDEFDAPDPETCDHFFEWHATHSYQAMVNGIPMTKLCTVTKCAKCGQIRHECQQRK